MDAIKKTSRFSHAPIRRPDGLPILAAMSPRQVNILRLLERHRYLTFDEIHANLGGDRTATRRTLRILKADPNNYIKVTEQDVAQRNWHKKMHYELDKAGINYLTKNGVLIPERKYVRNFEHASLASHATASIEAGITAAKNARLISWAEILQSEPMPARTKNLKHPNGIPVSYHIDGEIFEKTVYADTKPFGIELTRDDGRRYYRFFAGVEADTGSEPITTANFVRTSIFAKFHAYLAIEREEIYKTHFGFPNFYVLFLTTDPIRMKSMMAELDRITGGRGSKTIMFKVQRGDAPAGYLFTEPWERVGHQPIILAK